jgi:hypothetical protein
MMKRRNLWLGLVLVMIAVLGLAACGESPTRENPDPVELIDQGDGFNLVILTEKAAERLDIQTDTVREEQLSVTRSFGGEVTEVNSGSGAMVMVSLTANEMGMIDADIPALVFPLGSDDAEDSDEAAGFSAELDELPGMDDAEDNGVANLIYLVKDSNTGLVTGQRAIVEVSFKGNQGPRLSVPTAALLYGLNGETWIYINTEGLQFLRVPVVVDYIMGDTVVLVEGPAAGTKVVVVGVPELHGADTGVGK